jgi:hypothetical protein
MTKPVFNPATGYYESPRADGGVNKYTGLADEPSAEFKRLTNLYEEQKGRTLYGSSQPQTRPGQPVFGQKVLTEYQLHPELYPRPQVSALYKSPEKLQQEYEIDVATKKGLQPEFIKTMVGEIKPRYKELDVEASRAIQEANKNLAPGAQASPLVYKGHIDTPMEQKIQAGSFVNTTYVPDIEKVEGFHPAPAGYIGSKYTDPTTGVERKYTLADVAQQGYLIPKQGLEKFDFGIGSRYAPLGYFPKEGYWKPVGNVIMKEGRHEAGVLDYTSPAEGRLRAGKEGTLYKSESGQWLLVDVYGQAVSGGSVGSPLVAGTDYELTNKKLKQLSSPGTLISKGFTWATFPTESSLAKQKAAEEKIGFQAAEQRMYKTKYPEATFPAGKEFGVFPEPRNRFPESPALTKTPAATAGKEPEAGLQQSAAAGVLNLSWMGERAAFTPQTGQPTTVKVEGLPKVVIPSLGRPRASEGIEIIPGGRAGVGASQVPYREAAGVGAYPFKRSYEVGGTVGETAYAAGGEAERRTGLYQRSRPAEFPTYQNLTPMTGSGLFMPTGMATPTIPTAARGGMAGYTPPERMGEADLRPAWEGVLSGYGALQEGEAQRIARLESAKAAQRAAREQLGTRASPAGLPLESTVLEHQCLYSVHHTRAIPQHKPKTKGNIQKKGIIPKKPLVAHKIKGTGMVRHPRREAEKMERGYWNYEPTSTYILGLSNDQKPKKAKKPKSQR